MVWARSKHLYLYFIFAAMLMMNIGLWQSVRHVKAQWINVPPTPSLSGALAFSLGDRQFAYRAFGVTIQNFGDTGGRVTPLGDYDYGALGRWFDLQYALDSRSDYMPFLAAYVFGGSQKPDKLGPVIDYLEKAAGQGEGEKWRWMAQAVYLARFRMGDSQKALGLAEKMAAFENPDMPLWTRQMRAFILTDHGDKQAALDIMLNILQSGQGKLQNNEVNATLDYICTRILDPAQAANNELCAAPR